MSVQLGDILHIQKGKKPLSQSKTVVDGYLPYVDIKAFEKGIIDNYASTEKSLLCEGGDLLIVCDGSRSGLTGSAIKGVVGSTLAKISADGMTTEYLRYFIQSKYVSLNAQKKGTGTPHLNVEILKSFIINVPSPSEQNRIVSRIEELFSKLDKAVEILQTTKKQLAVYRQTVLKEAFEKLSKIKKVSDLCEVVRGGSPRPAGSDKYYDGNIPFLKVADLTENSGMYLSTHTYTIKKAGLTKTRMVEANTLLLSNSGATLGVPKICTFATTFNDGIAAFINFKQQEYLPYHYYYWMSKTVELRSVNQGAAQPNLNTTIIGNMMMPYCDYNMQVEISKGIGFRLSICDSIEKTVDATLSQAEAMRKSILKKAFEEGI